MNSDMVEWKADAPFKILIEDIRNFEKFQNIWIYKYSDGIQRINVNKILIQGKIIKTAGFSNEILIIDDGTGKVKVNIGPQVPGNVSWINSVGLTDSDILQAYSGMVMVKNLRSIPIQEILGLFCSIVGTLLDNGKLPLIQADKIAKITNQILLEMWPWEVKELKDVMVSKSFSGLMGGNDIIIHNF